MEGDNDLESSTQLEAMGFTSFGQQHKRPKHNHHYKPTSDIRNLPKKPLPQINASRETDARGQGSGLGHREDHGQAGPSGLEQGEKNRSLESNSGGYSSGGSTNSYYSNTFVENPWEKLEKEIGIFRDERLIL